MLGFPRAPKGAQDDSDTCKVREGAVQIVALYELQQLIQLASRCWGRIRSQVAWYSQHVPKDISFSQ